MVEKSAGPGPMGEMNLAVTRDDARAREVETALATSESMRRSPRMYEEAGTSAVAGHVRWNAGKSLWNGGMMAATLVLGPLTFTPGAFALFVVATAVTICLGHSLGMHRRLIHRSFDCPLWVEHVFIYLGTLVGLGGPTAMIRQHDIRDWAQRKPDCHPYLAHRAGFWRDYWWQNHCELVLDRPPSLIIEARTDNDRFYRFLDRGWKAQQLPWVVLFYLAGGLPWVVWGIAVRVTASVTGHWLIGYFAHNDGHRSWHVQGAGVQGYNVPYCGLFTMGEAHHNNHHAFPGSARLGLYEGETDPGWWVLKIMERLGLASNLKTPDLLPRRDNLVRLGASRPARGPAGHALGARNTH